MNRCVRYEQETRVKADDTAGKQNAMLLSRLAEDRMSKVNIGNGKWR